MDNEFDTQVKNIRQILIDKGLENKSIYYSEFLEIYDSYRSIMSEKDFAVLVLGVKTGNFNESKKGKHRIKILKNEQDELLKKYGAKTEKESEIQKNIARKIRPGTSINYSEFLELYELYKEELDMKEFARIIGLSVSNLNTMKNRGNKRKNTEILEKRNC